MTIRKLIIVLIFIPCWIHAEELIKQSIDLTINGRFAAAESLLVKSIESGDSTIMNYFYYASILNSKMTHYENNADEKQFVNILTKVIDDCEQKLENTNERNRAELLFYLGSAYGYLAFYEGKIGKWYAGLRHGLAARENLEQAVKTDSTLYDAYLGIGVYQYWLSTKFKWLPFVSDQREIGIKHIKKAVNKGHYSRYLGMHQLIYILLDHGDFDSALNYAKIAVEAYPKSQFMWWAYAHTLYKRKENAEAFTAYQHILNMIETDPEANVGHRLACYVKLAELNLRMEKTDLCLHFCQLAISEGKKIIVLSQETQKRIKKAEEMLSQCNQPK